MIELSIIKLLLKKDNYNKYSSIITKLNTEKEIKILIYLIVKYYEEFEHHNYIAIDELKAFFFLQYPNEKNNRAYELLFDQLAHLDVSDSMASNIVQQYIEFDCASQIVEKLLPIVQGHKGESVFEIPSLIEEYKRKALLVDEVASPFLEDDYSTLQSIVCKEKGLHWRLSCLNENIGPLIGGSLGHIFARPESGKTSFLTSEVTHFASQLPDDKRILWIWNEEPGYRIRSRLVQSALNMSAQEMEYLFRVRTDAADYIRDMYFKSGGDKILIPKEEDLQYEDIIALIEKYKNISILVMDIADHVGFRKSGDMAKHERLEELYRRLRCIANAYNIDILTAAQAAESASDRKHLYMEHMANSKTGKPGALDYAIGIGKTNNVSEEEMRWLSIPKNKLGSTVSSINAVYFDKQKGRYNDI